MAQEAKEETSDCEASSKECNRKISPGKHPIALRIKPLSKNNTSEGEGESPLMG